MLNQTKSKESKEVNVHNMFECKLRTMHTQNQTTHYAQYSVRRSWDWPNMAAQNTVYFFRILEYIGLTS